MTTPKQNRAAARRIWRSGRKDASRYALANATEDGEARRELWRTRTAAAKLRRIRDALAAGR